MRPIVSRSTRSVVVQSPRRVVFLIPISPRSSRAIRFLVTPIRWARCACESLIRRLGHASRFPSLAPLGERAG